MAELCRAGVPDDEGRGGCRMFLGGRPAECSGRALLCDWDLEAAELDVRALPRDYYSLEQELAPALGVWGDGTPRSKSRPLPLNERALLLQEEIAWLVDAWDDVARDVDRLSEKPRRVRQGWAVQQSVAILAPRLRRLAELETVTMWSYPGTEGASEVPGWQGVLDLARLHHRARRALGLTAARPEHCDGVPCRACDLKLLYRVPGEDAVRCDDCGDWLDADTYAEWVALVAAHTRGSSAA
jgi:hypothetical protein